MPVYFRGWYGWVLRLASQLPYYAFVDHIEMGRKGGLAGSAKLTPAQRKKRARLAARARWAKQKRTKRAA